jgi:hypothetical protein
MRTFTQKQNQPQKHGILQLARSNTVAPGPRRADLILHLHRTIGNQAAGDIERESVRRLAMRGWKRGCSFNFPVLL